MSTGLKYGYKDACVGVSKRAKGNNVWRASVGLRFFFFFIQSRIKDETNHKLIVTNHVVAGDENNGQADGIYKGVYSRVASMECDYLSRMRMQN